MDKTLDAFTDDVREMVEGVGTTLEPEDDWMPVLMLFGQEPTIIGIPSLGDPDYKQATCDVVIPMFIKKAKPEFAALVTMGWSVEYDRTTLEGRAEQARDEAKFAPGDISNRPSRYEVLAVHIVAKDGDERQLFGYVHRHKDSAPTVQWRTDLHPEGPKGTTAGRIPDALRAGMEAAWKK